MWAAAGATSLAGATGAGAGRTVLFEAPDSSDQTAALQRVLDDLAHTGGGTLRLGGNCRAGVLVLRGRNVVVDGQGHKLQNARLIVHASAREFILRDLVMVDTTGRSDGYHLDISGRDGRLIDITLLKEPMAGGYQAYLRQESQGCVFQRLVLRGSNGIFVAGRNHIFEDFDFTSTLRSDMGGDDAFAIKGAGGITENITLRRGTVRGFAAAVSIGSEIGSHDDHPGPGLVRGVSASEIFADRCQMLCFIKPGALIYDWRHGLVEDIVLTDLMLSDPEGFLFARGVAISAGRGARVRRVTGRNLRIAARASTQGVMPTAAIDIVIRRDEPAAMIEEIDLEVAFQGGGARAWPVDWIVRVEKDDPAIGTIRDVTLRVKGSHARIAGIYVGSNLDDAVTVTQADLRQIGLDPPATTGAAGIWADSRVQVRQANIDVVDVPQCGGRAVASLSLAACAGGE